MTIITTDNDSRLQVDGDGRTYWLSQSSDSIRYDSGIQIPPPDEIRNFAGTADALRKLADLVESNEYRNVTRNH